MPRTVIFLASGRVATDTASFKPFTYNWAYVGLIEKALMYNTVTVEESRASVFGTRYFILDTPMDVFLINENLPPMPYYIYYKYRNIFPKDMLGAPNFNYYCFETNWVNRTVCFVIKTEYLFPITKVGLALHDVVDRLRKEGYNTHSIRQCDNRLLKGFPYGYSSVIAADDRIYIALYKAAKHAIDSIANKTVGH